MNTKNIDYGYDIAISFLSQDEETASYLYDRLSPHFDVFIYSKKQEDLAGTDGTESFRKAFREDSRLVVVLYRDGWGETPWTRIEEGAIKDRFLKEGWDWLLFVMMDNKSKAPPWLPETRIRLSLEDYGIEQAIGAIKTRAQGLGSQYRKEDAVHRAKRLEREIREREKRNRLLASIEGVGAAKKEAKAIYSEITRLVNDINESSPRLKIMVGSNDESIGLTNGRVSLTAFFRPPYRNSLNYAQLVIQEMNGQVRLPQERDRFPFAEPKELNRFMFEPDVKPDGTWGWRLKSDPKRFFTSGEVADYCLKLFLNLINRADKGEIKPPDPF
ncbi:MAG: toll/interleukin-1 receptor domain-containing protein [Deltaproteobacteria bacterium]|nr:toll/interleukin-1 receptor domain-containing protein [Deltaproteobacteria bacterium]